MHLDAFGTHIQEATLVQTKEQSRGDRRAGGDGTGEPVSTRKAVWYGTPGNRETGHRVPRPRASLPAWQQCHPAPECSGIPCQELQDVGSQNVPPTGPLHTSETKYREVDAQPLFFPFYYENKTKQMPREKGP